MNRMVQIFLSAMIVLTSFGILVEAADRANSLNGLIGSAGIAFGVLTLLFETEVFSAED